MSIRIQKSKCAGCGRCIEACPGNLIKKDKENKAFIRQVRDCWGCTSCIKECRHDAIRFFLGADVGGRGASMVVSEKPDISTWTVEKPDGTKNLTVFTIECQSNGQLLRCINLAPGHDRFHASHS